MTAKFCKKNQLIAFDRFSSEKLVFYEIICWFYQKNYALRIHSRYFSMKTAIKTSGKIRRKCLKK